jgi:hypothetical protein
MQGCLPNGTLIAVKQLSSNSNQGNREFLNEIGIISALKHPYLVKLYGCCVEGDQLFLIYEYLENNSLARALFGNFFLYGLLWLLFMCYSIFSNLTPNFVVWLSDIYNIHKLRSRRKTNKIKLVNKEESRPKDIRFWFGQASRGGQNSY